MQNVVSSTYLSTFLPTPFPPDPSFQPSVLPQYLWGSINKDLKKLKKYKQGLWKIKWQLSICGLANWQLRPHWHLLSGLSLGLFCGENATVKWPIQTALCWKVLLLYQATKCTTDLKTYISRSSERPSAGVAVPWVKPLPVLCCCLSCAFCIFSCSDPASC